MADFTLLTTLVFAFTVYGLICEVLNTTPRSTHSQATSVRAARAKR